MVDLFAKALEERVLVHPADAVHQVEAVADHLGVCLLAAYHGVAGEPELLQLLLHARYLVGVDERHADEELELPCGKLAFALLGLLAHAFDEGLVVVHALADLLGLLPRLHVRKERENLVEHGAVGRGLGARRELLEELGVEVAEHRVHGNALLLDLVELCLHLGCVADVEEAVEFLRKPVADEDAPLQRHQLALLGLGVLARL